MKTVFLMKKLKVNDCYLTGHKMKKFGFFLGVIMLVSCTSNSIYKKPKDLIPKDTMTSLLTDLFIASSAFYEKNSTAEAKVNYVPYVYKKYKIDSLRFATSNLYYTSEIDLYNEIYKNIKQSLENKKKGLDEKKRVKDSINGARASSINKRNLK
jgi:hypothetical protein